MLAEMQLVGNLFVALSLGGALRDLKLAFGKNADFLVVDAVTRGAVPHRGQQIFRFSSSRPDLPATHTLDAGAKLGGWFAAAEHTFGTAPERSQHRASRVAINQDDNIDFRVAQIQGAYELQAGFRPSIEFGTD